MQLVEQNSSAGEVSGTLQSLQDQLREADSKMDQLKADKSSISQELSAKEIMVEKLNRLLEEVKQKHETERAELMEQREEDMSKLKDKLLELEGSLDKKNKDIKDSASRIIKMVCDCLRIYVRSILKVVVTFVVTCTLLHVTPIHVHCKEIDKLSDPSGSALGDHLMSISMYPAERWCSYVRMYYVL